MNLEDFYFGLVIVASVVLLAWLLDLVMDSIRENDDE
jgi:hypothetical protein